jgi:hypothetical protein
VPYTDTARFASGAYGEIRGVYIRWNGTLWYYTGQSQYALVKEDCVTGGVHQIKFFQKEFALNAKCTPDGSVYYSDVQSEKTYEEAKSACSPNFEIAVLPIVPQTTAGGGEVPSFGSDFLWTASSDAGGFHTVFNGINTANADDTTAYKFRCVSTYRSNALDR